MFLFFGNKYLNAQYIIAICSDISRSEAKFPIIRLECFDGENGVAYFEHFESVDSRDLRLGEILSYLNEV